jgi:hypothetical protein
VEITLAAHGSVGSSVVAFRRVAAFLVALFRIDIAAVTDGGPLERMGHGDYIR